MYLLSNKMVYEAKPVLKLLQISRRHTYTDWKSVKYRNLMKYIFCRIQKKEIKYDVFINWINKMVVKLTSSYPLLMIQTDVCVNRLVGPYEICILSYAEEENKIGRIYQLEK